MEAAENIGKNLANKGKYLVWKVDEKQQNISDDICLPFYPYFFLVNSLCKDIYRDWYVMLSDKIMHYFFNIHYTLIIRYGNCRINKPSRHGIDILFENHHCSEENVDIII